jgi:hypothetical protein
MFKPGDKVRCVDDKPLSWEQACPLKEGTIYIVRAFSEGYVYLHGGFEGWFPDRFILSDDSKKVSYDVEFDVEFKVKKTGECPCKIGIMYGQCEYHPG